MTGHRITLKAQIAGHTEGYPSMTEHRFTLRQQIAELERREKEDMENPPRYVDVQYRLEALRAAIRTLKAGRPE